MYFVLFILHNTDLLDDLINAWQNEGVRGATILFSTGLGRLQQKRGVRDDLPLMPSLDDFYEMPEMFSRTIFTLVQDQSIVDRLLKVTQQIVGDLNDFDTGIFLVLPVLQAYGFEKGQTR